MTSQVAGALHADNVYDEGQIADGVTVTPGMGVERVGTARDGKPILQPVSSIEPVAAQTRFATAQRLPPKSHFDETPMIDETLGDRGNFLQFYVFQRGDVVENALVASGTDLADDADVGGGTGSGSAQATVEVSEPLAFYSDGSLKVAQDQAAAIAEAREAVDNSGAAADDRARISIEVL